MQIIMKINQLKSIKNNPKRTIRMLYTEMLISDLILITLPY